MHLKTQIKAPRREHTTLHRKSWKVQEFDHGGQAERLAGLAPEVQGQGAHQASTSLSHAPNTALG